MRATPDSGVVAEEGPISYIKTSIFALLRLKKLVIAIDGPAGAGKSTTARLVAEKLGYLYVDTGAMYRAVTLKVLREGVPIRNEPLISEIAGSVRIRLTGGNEGLSVFLDDEDVTKQIRSADVTQCVSAVSKIRGVREALITIQRQIGSAGGVVLEGRDIGTVVFPNADLKIFMVADLNTRTERRRAEFHAQGREVEIGVVQEEIQRRDRIDSTREESPLTKAVDALELDTSTLSVDQQVDFVVAKAKELLAVRERG
jgi:cytidylate kinase